MERQVDLNDCVPCLNSIWTLHHGSEFYELATKQRHLATHDVRESAFYLANDKDFRAEQDSFIIIVEGYLTDNGIAVDDIKATCQPIVAVMWEGYNAQNNNYEIYFTDIRNLKKLLGIDNQNQHERTLIPYIVSALDFCK